MKESQYALIHSNKSHLSILVMLAWPAIVEQLLLTLVSYVDTAMVGSLGAGATAAVAINASPTWLINGLLSSMAVGYSVQVAQNIGAGDVERTRTVIRQAVLAVIVMGLGLGAVCVVLANPLPVWMGGKPEILPDARNYMRIVMCALPFQACAAMFSAILRCMGDTKTPLLFNAGTNVLNILFNTLFIFPTRQVTLFGTQFKMWGAGMGVSGAALGTALATGFVGTCLLLCVFRKKGPFQIHLRESYRPDREIISNAFRLGVSVALERTIVCAGQIAMTKMIASLGTVALAANHVAVTAEGISYLPATGISFAATTLVGQSVGARKKSEAKRYGWLSAWTGLGLSAIMGVLLFIFSVPLAKIFSSDPEVIGLASTMLRIVSVAEPMFGVSIVLFGVLRGANDPQYPLFISILCMICVRVVLASVLVYGFGVGLSAVWIAMAIDLNIRGLLCMLRFRKEKWAVFSGL